jgi:hypothetical protein
MPYSPIIPHRIKSAKGKMAGIIQRQMLPPRFVSATDGTKVLLPV